MRRRSPLLAQHPRIGLHLVVRNDGTWAKPWRVRRPSRCRRQVLIQRWQFLWLGSHHAASSCISSRLFSSSPVISVTFSAALSLGLICRSTLPVISGQFNALYYRPL